MSENLDKARFWVNFLLEHTNFPQLAILRQHLIDAKFHTFCPCGCYSFEITVSDRNALPALMPPKPSLEKGDFGFFTYDRQLTDGRQLTLTAFCDSEGMLSGIDVDVNTNTEPVPDPEEAARLLG